MKLSIIVPMYNVAPYVERCIRSLAEQDLPSEDYEIICVNDGSPDNCCEIVEGLKQEFANIVLINQENQGVSVARNKGIEAAHGEYIMFVDPDDYVLPRRLASLYKRAKRDELDILASGRSKVWPDGKSAKHFDYSSQENKIYSGVEGYFAKDIPYTVWDSSVGRLYKLSLVKAFDIQYPVGVVHIEDGVFVRKVFAVAKKVGFENYDFYQVFIRPGSTTRSDTVKKIIVTSGYIEAALVLKKFKEQHSIDIDQDGLLNESVAKYALLPLMWSIKQKEFKIWKSLMIILRSKGFNKIDSLKIKTMSYRYYVYAYNFSPYLFSLIYLMNLIKINIFKNRK